MNRKPFTILGALVCALVASGTLALLPAYADAIDFYLPLMRKDASDAG